MESLPVNIPTIEQETAFLDGENVVSVSGGKDSLATLLLALERNLKKVQAVFADTGHEHPKTYEYVEFMNKTVFPIRTVKADFAKQIEKKRETVQTKWREEGVPEEKIQRTLKVLKPTGVPFLDLCLLKGRFPSTRARFCSEELKQFTIARQVNMPILSAGFSVISWQGVRRDESPARALLPQLELKAAYEDYGNGVAVWNYRPIIDWTAAQVFEKAKASGIPSNPLYLEGFGRVGCFPCIHARKDEMLEMSRRYPEEIERVAEWERLVAEASKRDDSTFFSTEKGRGVGIKEVTEWSRTSRGGKQVDLFRNQHHEDPLMTCSSVYGLCE